MGLLFCFLNLFYGRTTIQSLFSFMQTTLSVSTTTLMTSTSARHVRKRAELGAEAILHRRKCGFKKQNGRGQRRRQRLRTPALPESRLVKFDVICMFTSSLD